MHPQEPKVSVLVPTYNRSHLLKETLDSVFQQSFIDFELIVVDNGSTDNTLQVIESFKDSRLVYVRNEINIGAVNNYNKALRLARGEYVYLFSDDDLMTDIDNLKIKVDVLDTYSSVGLVHSDYDVFDETGRTGGNHIATTPIWQKIHPVPLLKGEAAYPIIYLGANFVSMTSAMIRNSVLKKNGLEFNNQLRYVIDWNLWLQMSLFCDFYYIDRVTTAHRRHATNESLLGTGSIYYKEEILAKIGLITLFGHTGKIPVTSVSAIVESIYNPDSFKNILVQNFGRVQRRIKRIINFK